MLLGYAVKAEGSSDREQRLIRLCAVPSSSRRKGQRKTLRSILVVSGVTKRPAMNRSIYTQATREIWRVEAVVVYDNSESSYAAKALLDRVAANAGGELQFSPAFWQIDGLSCTATNVEFVRDLLHSSIVVLALCAARDLPTSVFGPLKSWAQCRFGRESALVVLGNGGPGAVKKLGEVLKWPGIRLFCEKASPPGLDWQDDAEGLEKQEPSPELMMEAIPICSRFGNYRDWGLNE